MIRETLQQIKSKIQTSDSIKPESKEELLGLLGNLQKEVEHLSSTNPEHAESVMGFTRSSAHEATRTDPNPHLMQLSLDGLNASVKGFETSHPKLVEVVNAIATSLSNLGI